MSGLLLAVDAGGTNTRAVALTRDGECRGAGRGASGNPTASGPVVALASIVGACRAALQGAGGTVGDVEGVVVAMAGAEGLLPPAEIAAGLGFRGPAGRVEKVGDLLGMYFSGAVEADGVALIAGTGSVAGRITGGALARVVGGSGWLLGDGGSGFWAGVRVARAVVADLDGTGEPTALTDGVLADLGLVRGGPVREGRSVVLHELTDALYALPPVALARFAPLAVAAAPTDHVAAELLRRAGDVLAHLLRTVRAGDGPLVAGGSFWARGILGSGAPASALLAEVLDGADLRPADDGLLGAAVLALRRETEVGPALHARARESLARVRLSGA